MVILGGLYRFNFPLIAVKGRLSAPSDLNLWTKQPEKRRSGVGENVEERGPWRGRVKLRRDAENFASL